MHPTIPNTNKHNPIPNAPSSASSHREVPRAFAAPHEPSRIRVTSLTYLIYLRVAHDATVLPAPFLACFPFRGGYVFCAPKRRNVYKVSLILKVLPPSRTIPIYPREANSLHFSPDKQAAAAHTVSFSLVRTRSHPPACYDCAHAPHTCVQNSRSPYVCWWLTACSTLFPRLARFRSRRPTVSNK